MESNLSVQKQFKDNFAAQVGYVGTRAYHLWNNQAQLVRPQLSVRGARGTGGQEENIEAEVRA
jgi:hypothetical protein